VRPPPMPSSARPPLPPPKGKGTGLWKRYYQIAVENGHPNPEKMADSLLRNREMTQELEQARRRLQVTENVPRPNETEKISKKGRAIPSGAFRCKATKLDGKQCVFRCFGSTDFCTKHAVKKTLI